MKFYFCRVSIAYLMLGSNQGDRLGYLREAISLLMKQAGHLTSSSPVFRSEPWGEESQEEFLNQAVCLETSLKPAELLGTILEIEGEMGRVRSRKWEPRIIDIDILLYDTMILDSPDLVIPHPFMAERRFVLAPLARIAGTVKHPLKQQTIDELLAACPDSLKVWPLDDY